MTDATPLPDNAQPATEAAQPWDLQALLALARAGHGQPGCPRCRSLVCPGWETLPAGFDDKQLQHLGSLRAGPSDDDPGAPPEEPTWEEFHPQGTRSWSADAPIALGYHPCNRCDVYRCTGCPRAFLRYTEFGGYYVDHRIRELDPALLCAPLA